MPKKENIEQMFDDIAPSYDRLNHILSFDADRSWRRRAVRKTVDSRETLHVLDVACGTGDLTIALAKRILKRGEGDVSGIDLSENMLAIGREKVAQAGLTETVTLRQGDGEHLPYPDGSFDRVTSAFGIRNFEHIERGLKEMRRVLVPGGKIVILELSMPRKRLIKWIYKIYFTKMLPLIGRVVSGDKSSYRYLPASVIKFPVPDRFCSMMRSAGFRNVRQRAFTLGVCRMYIGFKK